MGLVPLTEDGKAVPKRERKEAAAAVVEQRADVANPDRVIQRQLEEQAATESESVTEPEVVAGVETDKESDDADTVG